MSLRNKLFADGLYSLSFRIANMAVAAILGILTARALGPSGRGIYALPLVAFAVATAGYAGLSNSVTYYMLRRDAGRAVLRAGLICAGLFVLAGIPVVVIVAYTTHAPWAAWPAIAALPAPALLSLFFGYQIGTDRVRMNNSYALMNTLLQLVVLLVAFGAFGRQPAEAIAAWVIAPNLFAAGALVWLFRDARRLNPGTPIPTGQFLGYSLRVGAVSLVSLLNYRADMYIVAALGGATMLGMYSVAVTAAEMLLAATQVTAAVSSPHIGGLESPRAAAELTARCVRNNVVIALVLCATLWFAAPLAVRILYGAAFLPMIPAFRVLLIGVFALSLGSPMSTFFTIRLGKPQIPMVLALTSATICIVVSILLIHPLGLVGAAIGSTAGYAVGQAAAIVVFVRITKLSIPTVVIPRRSDVAAYGHASLYFLRRIRGATP